MSIELYRESKGYYPQSLEGLLLDDSQDEKGKQSTSNFIYGMRHNAWHNSYEYRPSTNGFTITVTGPDIAPAGWFGKQRKVEKHYEIGEALKQ
jgi:hypothetical protein